jgi:putative nucleotidyltransferase with HDIG domain
MKKWPSKIETDALLAWGGEQNPGPWTEHCKNVARAAETIAKHSGMDTERAYASGLLHDIGYSVYHMGICHVYGGYKIMTEKGYDAIAEICLSHSFNIPDIHVYSSANLTQNKDEREIIIDFLAKTEYTDYDKLIQLCDCLGSAQGICLMEQRMMDVVMRHGFNQYTIEKWKAYFALKDYFDKKCGLNIYNLFEEEISKGIFNRQNKEGKSP